MMLKINENITTVNFNKGAMGRIRYIVVHFTGIIGTLLQRTTLYTSRV